jgi:hypothetical protein
VEARSTNLDAIRLLVTEAKSIHTYAPYSLLHLNIENAAVTVWQLQPDDNLSRHPSGEQRHDRLGS